MDMWINDLAQGKYGRQKLWSLSQQAQHSPLQQG